MTEHKQGYQLFSPLFIILFLLSFSFKSQGQIDSIEYAQWNVLYDEAHELMSSKPDSSLSMGLKYYEWAMGTKDSFEIAYANDLIGSAYYYTNQLQLASQFHQIAYNYFYALKDTGDVIGSLINLGNVYSDQGFYQSAINRYLRSIELQKEINDTEGLAVTYSNISLVFFDQEDYANTKNYLLRSLKYARKIKLDEIIATNFNTWSELLILENKLDSALLLTIQACVIAEKENLVLELANCHSNKGQIFLLRGDSDSAFAKFDKAVELAKLYGDPFSEIIYLNKITQAYLSLGMKKESLSTALKAHEQAHNTAPSRYLRQTVSFNLSSAHRLNGNYMKALECYHNYHNYYDTIKLLSIQEKILEYDNVLKDQKNELLQSNVTLEKKVTRNNQLLLLISFSLLAIGISFILLLSFHVRKNNKLNADLKKKNSIILLNQKEIDDQKHEVVKKNMELNSLLSSKDKLMAILTHDLKQPFNQLHYILELLEMNAFSEEERIQMLADLKESLRNTRETTDNLLIWSKTQFGGFNTHFEKVDIVKVAHKVKEQQASLFRQAGVKNLVEHSCSEAFIFADIEQMTIAIRNLVTNALRFSKRLEAVTIRIRLSSDKVVVDVVDTGPGMSESQVNHLQNMDRLMQDPGNITAEGTGLGILIVSEFIQNNNGRLSIHSELGIGSIFSISFPAMS